MTNYSNDYLLNKQVKIFQPLNGYRASTDAVILSSLVNKVKPGDKILDVGSGTGAISLCLAARFRKKNRKSPDLNYNPSLLTYQTKVPQPMAFEQFLNYINADIRTPKAILPPCSFRHVISNPPYSDHDMPSPNQSKAFAHNHHDFNLTEWIKFCIKMTAPKGFYIPD